jgi:acyl-CoA synthetase (NDP forming)
VLDCPPEDKADTTAFMVAIDAFISAAQDSPTRAVLIASLPETLSPSVRQLCQAAGVVPLQGQREALEALSLAGTVGETWSSIGELGLRIPPAAQGTVRTLAEGDAKQALAAYGLPIPRSCVATREHIEQAAQELGFPVVIKVASTELAHKSDVGGVVLNVRNAREAAAAADKLRRLSDEFLVEEMIVDGVAEILVGALIDPQFGLTLVVGAGGVMTELLQDSVSFLPPFNRSVIETVLRRLTVNKLLHGFRGRPAADMPALIDAIVSVGRYAEANLASLVELDVNPVIVRAAGAGAVAVDALIRLT